MITVTVTFQWFEIVAILSMWIFLIMIKRWIMLDNKKKDTTTHDHCK